MATKLTDKQRRFVEFYCGECKFNATQSAIKAGYSEKTARQVGSENLSKPDIQEYISEFMNQATEEAEVTTEWVVKRLKKLADPDSGDVNASACVAACGKLSDYTGGFDKNKNHTVHSGSIGLKDISQMSDEELENELNQ